MASSELLRPVPSHAEAKAYQSARTPLQHYLRDRIDESIRLHDKLLIVLSQASIASPWVRREVEAAFEREDRQKSIVLFPVRVDDAVMETNEAWAADIRRTRQIGDFTQWKDHDSYQKAFARLVRDLTAESQQT